MLGEWGRGSERQTRGRSCKNFLPSLAIHMGCCIYSSEAACGGCGFTSESGIETQRAEVAERLAALPASLPRPSPLSTPRLTQPQYKSNQNTREQKGTMRNVAAAAGSEKDAAAAAPNNTAVPAASSDKAAPPKTTLTTKRGIIILVSTNLSNIWTIQKLEENRNNNLTEDI